jgi:uncharacterized radical SAM superfamily Fe-S cluster-containing enzyme
MKQSRDYIFHEATMSLCSVCSKNVPAKLLIENNHIYIQKSCNEHGIHTELLEEDADYHLSKRKFDKSGTFTHPDTSIAHGCPNDCGLCPDHDQHTCIGLIEITNRCNLQCPVCFANSGNDQSLSVATINKMLDFYVDAEDGDAEILQISGGEPTIHPNIIEILELALSKHIRYVMLNTNGIRIATDIDFVKQLSKFNSRFEVYLQFDGFKETTYQHLRGTNILDLKLQAITNLLNHEIPVTLVSSIVQGVNDDEIGEIIKFGMEKKGIRGINFQPIAFFGRNNTQVALNRTTLSGIIRQIELQASDIFTKGDIIPLPCNVERVAIAYLIKGKKGKFIPLARKVEINSYLPIVENTFAFDADRVIDSTIEHIKNEMQLCDCFKLLNDIREFFPKSYLIKNEADKREFINENTFRISVTSFIDKYNFDLKSMQKECVHILTPDNKRIPFSAYNMFHRK